jgi:iron complex outermembrane receptor protein
MTSYRLMSVAPWLGAASALALAATPVRAQDASADAAQAQPADSQADSEEGDNDILVTAQRREQRLQDVPISITALSGASLDERSMDNLADLPGSVPSLVISGFAGTNTTNLVAIRGVAGQQIPIGASQATAIYLDGVYLSRPDSAFFGFDDIERIEVLRGPQGTLYGRNATAGAINIVTRTPGDTLEGSVNATYGNYNSYSLRGSISGPLGGGFSIGASGGFDHHGGYYTNTVTGNRVNDRDSQTARIRLRYDNDAGFDATVSADYTHITQQDLYTPVTIAPNGDILFQTRFVQTNLPEDDIGTTVKTGGIALTMNIELSPRFTLTSISSYREFSFFTIYDVDASAAAAPLIHVITLNENETFSQEIRGVYTGNGFRVTFGANYYGENGDYSLINNRPVINRQVLAQFPSPHNKTNVQAVAAFGQVEVDVTDRLTAVAGLRFNHESRDFSTDYSAIGAFPPIIGKISDSVLLPMVGLNFEANDDLLFYVKASQGYQAPGFNFLPGPGTPENTFGPETLWAYEAGVKSQFWDRRITFNAAGFYYKYDDIQVRSLINPQVAQIRNAAAAQVTGVEAELIVRPATGLTLSGHVTYSRAIYTDFCESVTVGTPQNGDPLCVGTPVVTADRSGRSLPQAPRWSGGFDINYSAPLSGSLTLNANASYTFETISYLTAPNERAISTGGFERINARIGLEFANGLEVYAFGRNLTDERHLAYSARLSTFIVGVVSEPRTYGIGARYRF